MALPMNTPEPHTSIDWPQVCAKLRDFALALSRSSSDADDLVQQTLAILLTRRPEEAGNLAFARKTLARQWLDTQRSLRRRLARYRRLSVPIATTPADDVDRDEQVQRIAAAIERLPPRQRVVLALRLIEDLNTESIAEVLDCSVQSVRSNLHLARRRVRRILGEAS